MTVLRKHLQSIGACEESLEWVGARTPRRAWEECERADWLLWWAARTSVNTHQEIVLASCACARLVLKYVPKGENRPRLAIEAAERWAANPSEANRRAAFAAAFAASAAFAAASAASAINAINAAFAAASAAFAAASAASAAASAISAAPGKRMQKKMCRLVRGALKLPYRKATEPKADG